MKQRPKNPPLRQRNPRRAAILAAIALAMELVLGSNRPPAAAATPKSGPDPSQANTSDAARCSAVQSIPIEQLDADARAKVASVLSNVSLFRRMPIRVIDCDPHFYLFLVRHPDVVVNIWEVLKLSSLNVQQVGPNTFRVVESGGTSADFQFLYRSFDKHVIYAEGTYEGPLLGRKVKGRCLMVLKTGYIRETNGRYFITSRLDTFLSVDRGGAALLAKTLHPWMGNTADHNFVQSVSFLGSLSKTAEVNSRGVQRLSTKLARVRPEVRLELAKLAARLGKKQAPQSAGETPQQPRVATQPKATQER